MSKLGLVTNSYLTLNLNGLMLGGRYLASKDYR